MSADETRKSIWVFGNSNIVMEALEKFFGIFGYKVEDKNSIKSINDIKGEVVVYLDSVDYQSLADVGISGSGCKVDCLGLIENGLRKQQPVTLVTPRSNDHFPSLCVVPWNLSAYFEAERVPTSEENLRAVSKVFSDVGGHDLHEILQNTKLVNSPRLNNPRTTKTVLIVDDHLCDGRTAIGHFFMQSLEKYGHEKNIRFIFTTTPADFMRTFYMEPVDIVFVDLDYSLWAKSPDFYKAQSINYVIEGINRVGWRIIDKIVEAHVKGRIPKRSQKDQNEEKDESSIETGMIFELLPRIVVFTAHEIEENHNGSGIRIIQKNRTYELKEYKYVKETQMLRRNDSEKNFTIDLLLCPKKDSSRLFSILETEKLCDDVQLEYDEATDPPLNRKQLLQLRRILKGFEPGPFKVKYGYVVIEAHCDRKNTKNIDTGQKAISKRINEYKERVNPQQNLTIREQAEWVYRRRSPYQDIRYSLGTYSPLFDEGAFKDPSGIEKLCQAISADFPEFEGEDIKALNEFLERTDYYNDCPKEIKDDHSIKEVVSETKIDFSQSFGDLNPDAQQKIRELNRSLIELRYAGICPIGRMANKRTKFCGEDFDNPILLAATPITAIQHHNNDTAKQWYEDKIKMLLSTGVGGLVLKTAYYNVDDHYETPSGGTPKSFTHIQDKSITRVFCNTEVKEPYIRSTLYNTGHTKSENFTFLGMLDFLRENTCFQNAKIILSVGSKSYEPLIWEAIFDKIKGSDIANPLIEINARHTIREILKDDDISEIFDEYVIYGQHYGSFYEIFRKWISHIHDLAAAAKKKLIIKLPFRSDLIQLLQICDVQARRHPCYGIKGVTLINTVKAPYPFTAEKPEGGKYFNPGRIFHEVDVFGLPQLSGSGLKYLRDWALFQASRYVKNVDISASGGIDDKNDVDACLSMGAKTVQVGTLALREFPKGISEILNATPSEYKHPLTNLLNKNKRFLRRYADVMKDECKRCEICTCLKTYYCDAFKNKYRKEEREKILKDLDKTSATTIEIPLDKGYPIIDESLCLGCGLCAQTCKNDAIKLIELAPEKT